MILESEKEFRQVLQVAVATALGCWGFPILAVLLVILILPWQPIYRVAAHLGGVVLDLRAKRTVKRAMKNLHEEPVHVT
jgi:Na+-transporting NADH:ubiquinone oxidoreductase subunit NqrB